MRTESGIHRGPVGRGARRARRATALALVSIVPLATAGCFGTFQLTKKLYEFNREASDDKWIRWIVFLPLSFFYGGAAMLDGVFFNSIEFWTGENPVLTARHFEGPNGEHAVVRVRSASVFDAVVTTADGRVHRAVLRRQSDGGFTVEDAAGRLMARAAPTGGRPELVR